MWRINDCLVLMEISLNLELRFTSMGNILTSELCLISFISFKKLVLLGLLLFEVNLGGVIMLTIWTDTLVRLIKLCLPIHGLLDLLLWVDLCTYSLGKTSLRMDA